MSHQKMNPTVSRVKDIDKILGPAWLFYMVKIAAAVHHKEEALRDATIPLIREFREKGDIKPIIRAACEVLGNDFIDTVDWKGEHFLESRRAKMMVTQARKLVEKALE